MTVKIQNPDEQMKLAKHTFSYFLNTHSDKKGSICLPQQPLLHEGIEELLQSPQHGRHLQQSHEVLGQSPTSESQIFCDSTFDCSRISSALDAWQVSCKLQHNSQHSHLVLSRYMQLSATTYHLQLCFIIFTINYHLLNFSSILATMMQLLNYIFFHIDQFLEFFIQEQLPMFI